jgi:hypothetical protein
MKLRPGLFLGEKINIRTHGVRNKVQENFDKRAKKKDR